MKTRIWIYVTVLAGLAVLSGSVQAFCFLSGDRDNRSYDRSPWQRAGYRTPYPVQYAVQYGPATLYDALVTGQRVVPDTYRQPVYYPAW